MTTKGLTLLEVTVALAVMGIGLSALISATMAIDELSLSNQEQLIALNAARQKIAEMKDESFSTLFSQYGPGSSSNTFDLSTLQRGALTNGTGKIVFPVNAAGKLDETVVDTNLGMPQDLNGNGTRTDTDVSGSYTVLPVRIQITWTSRTGSRELSINTMLTKLK